MNIKKIITEEILSILNESIEFSVDGYNYNENPQTVFDVSWAIQQNLWRNVITKKLNQFQIAAAREKGDFFEFVSPDGYDATEEMGTVNFYFTDTFEPIIDDCVAEIKATLRKLNVKSGAFKVEQSNSRNSEVMRIPVSINTNAESAPQFNMANGNYREVMGWLGFDTSEDSGIVPANQLLMKISTAKNKLSGADIRDNGRVKVNNPQLNVVGDEPKGNNVYGRELGKDNYNRYFDQLEEIARWALKNGYSNISFG